MTPLEYNTKLREANQILRDEKIEKLAEPFRERICFFLVMALFVIAVGNFAKAHCDYTVSFWVCSICGSKVDSPSCCEGAQFSGIEYTVPGDPPPIWQ